MIIHLLFFLFSLHLSLKGVKNVLVKLGSRGSLMVTKSGETIRQLAFKPPLVVDTTGAGDCFTGACVLLCVCVVECLCVVVCLCDLLVDGMFDICVFDWLFSGICSWISARKVVW